MGYSMASGRQIWENNETEGSVPGFSNHHFITQTKPSHPHTQPFPLRHQPKFFSSQPLSFSNCWWCWSLHPFPFMSVNLFSHSLLHLPGAWAGVRFSAANLSDISFNRSTSFVSVASMYSSWAFNLGTSGKKSLLMIFDMAWIDELNYTLHEPESFTLKRKKWKKKTIIFYERLEGGLNDARAWKET